MLIRYTVFLLFLTTTLSAQSPQWQAYLNATYLIGGAETEDALWLACSNSLAKFDLRTGKEELLHFQNSAVLPGMSDIQQIGEDAFVLLGGENKLITYQAGDWSTQTLEPTGNTLQFIAGQTQDGELILTGENKLYKLPSGGELQYLPYGEQTLPDRYIQIAELDREDRLWLMVHDKIVQLAPDGTLLNELPVVEEYLYDMKLDEADNLWLTSNKHVYFWHNAEAEWKTLALEDLGINNSSSAIVTTTGQAAVLTLQNYVLHVTWENGGFQTEDWSHNFAPNFFPGTYNYQDSQGKVWYFSYERGLLQWEPGDHAVEVANHSPWLELYELSALGLDPQGKVWLGGMGQAAYLSGGRWLSLPIDTAEFALTNINDFTFQANGRPIVGTGNLFSFGFPDCQVRAYNGTTWDTLTEATLTTSFLPITDVILDRDENLWVLRAGGIMLSVKSWGDWHRIRTSDLPLPITSFTCLTEDPAGGMWIGTNNGLLYHDGFSMTHIDTTTLQTDGNPIMSIDIDDQGKKWVSLGDGGLRRETDTGWEIMNGFRDLVPFGALNQVVCGTYPELWVSMNWSGVLYYNGQDWAHWQPENTGLMENYVRDMLLDNQGRMWFCHGSGVSLYSPQGQTIKPYLRPQDQPVGVFPNPGCCLFNVNWNASQAGNHQLYLYSATGQLVRRWEVNAASTGEQSFIFEQKDLPAGNYFLTVRQNEQQIGAARIVFIK